MFFEALERVSRIGQKHAGKVYTPEGITRLIRSQFRDPGLRFYTDRELGVESGNFILKGEYRPYEDLHNEPSIHITLVFPKRQRRVYIDRYNWDRLGFIIADTLTHEYIHQYHCRRRGYDHGPGYRGRTNLHYLDSMQDYLGCEDEILAFGFNIASEMVVYQSKMERTRIYRLYKRYFRQDQKILLKLEKQTIKYLKQLEQLQ